MTGRKGSTVTSSAADSRVRPLAPTVGELKTGPESVKRGPSTNRILKTVHIETVEEHRDDSELDVEMQTSAPA